MRESNLGIDDCFVFFFTTNLLFIYRLNVDKQAAEDLMIELGNECERLRTERGPALPTTSSETLRLEELHQEMEELRHTNKILEETNEELQALMLNRGIEEGRHLLNGTSNSLAQELEAMSQNQVRIYIFF
jgi:Rab11 family-interacting protein 3/4